MTEITTRAGASPGPFEPFRSLWRHRQLYRRVLTRDIEASFRGSALGVGWVVLIPLVLVAVYTFVFGQVLGAQWAGGSLPGSQVPLVYFTGIVLFGFFMEVITRAPNFVRENKIYVTKIVFPLDILAWVIAGTALFKLCVNLLLLAVALLLVTGRLPAGFALLPLVIVPLVLMSVGIAWVLSSVGAFVRDLAHALQAVAPVILFISPVFYALDQVPAAFHRLYHANPLTFVLESARGLLFFGGTLPPAAWALYCAVSVAVFAFGYRFFQRLRPGFADVV